jgi:hypothetical protein
MNAPARIVAVSRAEAKEVNIGKPLLHLWSNPPLGSNQSMQEACQFEKAVIYQS